ncbi:MAG TPA: tripartite tricarboxylate transporter TctB family protein [Clostridia bacterium]|nr:tripartite tricarboxylate transporter TctB family protein [Clostridia bacterium]
MYNTTLVSSLVFLFIAVAAWYAAGSFSELSSFFPRVVAVIMAIFCVLQIIQSLINRQKEAPFAGVEPKRLIAMFAGIIGYVVMMVYLGFIISSILYLIFFFWLLGRGKETSTSIPKIVLLGVGVPVFFYVLFYYIFIVPLPMGLFFGG